MKNIEFEFDGAKPQKPIKAKKEKAFCNFGVNSKSKAAAISKEEQAVKK
jgi:hypothetical protein